jgi:hypothetical protein
MEVEDDDYMITDARSGGYMLIQNNRSLGKYRDRDAAFAAAQKRMDRDGVYSNVFYMNERGTVDLLDAEGNFARSNPLSNLSTGETVALVAAGVVVIGGIGYWLYSKSQAAQASPVQPVQTQSTQPAQLLPPVPGTIDQVPPFVPSDVSQPIDTSSTSTGG